MTDTNILGAEEVAAEIDTSARFILGIAAGGLAGLTLFGCLLGQFTPCFKNMALKCHPKLRKIGAEDSIMFLVGLADVVVLASVIAALVTPFWTIGSVACCYRLLGEGRSEPLTSSITQTEVRYGLWDFGSLPQGSDAEWDYGDLPFEDPGNVLAQRLMASDSNLREAEDYGEFAVYATRIAMVVSILPLCLSIVGSLGLVCGIAEACSADKQKKQHNNWLFGSKAVMRMNSLSSLLLFTSLVFWVGYTYDVLVSDQKIPLGARAGTFREASLMPGFSWALVFLGFLLTSLSVCFSYTASVQTDYDDMVRSAANTNWKPRSDISRQGSIAVFSAPRAADPPSTPAAVELNVEDEKLPEGWKKLWSEDEQVWYYQSTTDEELWSYEVPTSPN